eukprot:119208-Hanusia_phi.AAC.2
MARFLLVVAAMAAIAAPSMAEGGGGRGSYTYSSSSSLSSKLCFQPLLMKAGSSEAGARVQRRRIMEVGLGVALGGAMGGRMVHAEGMMEALRKRVTGNEAGEQGGAAPAPEDDGCQSMLCFQTDRTGLGEEGKEGAMAFAVPKGYKKTEEGKWEDGAGGMVEVRRRSIESSGVKLKDPPKRAAGPMGEASVKLSVAQGTEEGKVEIEWRRRRKGGKEFCEGSCRLGRSLPRRRGLKTQEDERGCCNLMELSSTRSGESRRSRRRGLRGGGGGGGGKWKGEQHKHKHKDYESVF